MSVVLPSPELPAGARSALVIAVGEYQDPALARLRSPARDAAELAEVLSDPRIGAFAVTVLSDPGAHALRVGIEDFLSGRGTDEIVVVYLSCHGVLDARRRLHFAAADTNKDRLASTGVEARWMVERLDECRARRQVVVLDCCFSGAFALTKAGQGAQDVGLQEGFEVPEGRGRSVLTASRATEYSFEGEKLADGSAAGSVFTAALVDGLRSGAADLDRDGLVSVSDLYAFTHARVTATGAKQTPQRWVFGGEGEVFLARSAAGRVVAPAELTGELRLLLDSGSPRIRAAGVAELGDWLAGPDPRRVAAALIELERMAAREHPDVADAAKVLLRADADQKVDVVLEKTLDTAFLIDHPESIADRAERSAADLADPKDRAATLVRLVSAVAKTDPERAERITATIANPNQHAWALAEIAGAVAGADTARAERIAGSITYPLQRAKALLHMLRAVGSTDIATFADVAQRAERAAAVIPDPDRQAYALAEVACAVGDIDPAHAERLAAIIAADVIEPDYQAELLSEIAEAVARIAPPCAQRIAAMVTDVSWQAYVLGVIAQEVAKIDPLRAEGIAAAIIDPVSQARELAEVAKTAAQSDPAVAIRIVGRAENAAAGIGAPALLAQALIAIVEAVAVIPGIDQAVAERIIGGAERAVADMADQNDRFGMLIDLAREVARIDLVRAERIAVTIVTPARQVSALCVVAEVAADVDPAASKRISERAEHVAAVVKDLSTRFSCMINIARAVAADDPDRAERLIANPIQPELCRSTIHTLQLMDVIEVLAADDPIRAERVARTLVGPGQTAKGLVKVVKVLAPRDPDRAESIADTIVDPLLQASALIEIVNAAAKIPLPA